MARVSGRKELPISNSSPSTLMVEVGLPEAPVQSVTVRSTSCVEVSRLVTRREREPPGGLGSELSWSASPR